MNPQAARESTSQAIKARLDAVRERIARAESRFGRPAGAVTLVAVSKGITARHVRQAAELGQRRFGESYLQEALPKLRQLSEPASEQQALEWHFIGSLQSNKSRAVAQHFDWVHTVDRLSIAQRLSSQRPDGAPPLNVCIQVNVSAEASKSGVSLRDLPALAAAVAAHPTVVLRGLMTVPAPVTEFAEQRKPFRVLSEALMDLQRRLALPLDTLSMGMSADLEAAIAEGATIVRVGTAIFGPRSIV